MNDNFIKQCEASEEIQREYIPIWSFVLVKPCWAVNIITQGVVTCAANEPRYCDVFMNGNQCGGIEMKDIIYLPTQEQLQSLLNITDWQIMFKKFRYFYKYATVDNIFLMNELWLAFVMYEKYNKIWNGEKWEAI